MQGKEVVVEVQCSSGVKKIIGEVIYATPSGKLFDIAVISLGRNKSLQHLPLADKPPCKGIYIVRIV